MKLPRLYPPIWFGTMILIVFLLHRFLPLPYSSPSWVHLPARGFMWTGGALIALAFIAFYRHHTPVLPFNAPTALLRSGVFRWSRNPIYLGEVLILAGACLRIGDTLPWLTIPLFIIGLNNSAISWEESTLRARFGSSYEDYCRRTRRWI